MLTFQGTRQSRLHDRTERENEFDLDRAYPETSAARQKGRAAFLTSTTSVAGGAIQRKAME
jgi:hypothetical protein